MADALTTEESPDLLRRFGRWAVRRFYGTLNVTGAERIPQTGPVLICGNHANALLDAVLLGIAARRPVRFLAKAPLFDVPVLGRLLHGLGMIPTFRASDDASQVKRSLDSLSAGATALAGGAAVGIFPEGKSTDPAHLATLRSGTARMAIQALEAGAEGLQIVPVGMVYEAKERSGSEVWLRVGEPIDVSAFLAGHAGHPREQRQALTAELTARLKAVVVHLDDPAWEPWLDDLELLLPAPNGGGGPLAQRKRIADAINHFQAADPPLAEAVAKQITALHDAVAAERLRVNSPILRMRGWRVAVLALWDAVRLVLGLVPAVVGTLHHAVPFAVILFIARRLDHPGKKTHATHRLMAAVPIYTVWYGLTAWWMVDYFTPLFTVLWLALMPFAGVVALAFWRRLADAAPAAAAHAAMVLRRSRLRALRAQFASLQDTLRGLAERYAAVDPRPEAPPRGRRRDRVARAGAGLLVVAVLATLGWVAAYGLRSQTLLDEGLDLAALPPARVRAQLAADVPAVGRFMRGLEALEADALALQGEFAEGARGFVVQADNDAVRELLRRFLTFRAGLLRVAWRYQRYDELADPALRLEAFLADYAALALLHDASLKFVHGFEGVAGAVERFNEPEPNWDIPPGLYNSVRRTLANPANRRLLAAAAQLYDRQREAFTGHGLGPTGRCAHLHDAVARSRATAERLDPAFANARVAIADLAGLVDEVRYETQSAFSTWLGDFKIRRPHDGRHPITTALQAELQQRLQPGDIVLERRNWFLSNAFLPGYWPHSALYVGTVADLEARGLTGRPAVAAQLERFRAPDAEGHTHVFIESISEGVVFTSLEHSVGEADAVAVLRAAIPPAEVNDAIARAFSLVGRPYDFEFDFASTDKLVCTELVYRAYGGNSGTLQFPIELIMGRTTMPAVNLVRKYRDERGSPDAQLRFLAWIDSDDVTGQARFLTDEASFLSTLDRPALTWLQGLERGELRSVRGFGPLGWVLGLLTLLALGANSGAWWRERRRAAALDRLR
ncbi:MAG: 1-acyl-sn-glycerol-3-phosphate acyltransferase [Planctomycetota bacterium]|jgi:1-acyl-sn-glycerol-3-phosphate acyltransferase